VFDMEERINKNKADKNVDLLNLGLAINNSSSDAYLLKAEELFEDYDMEEAAKYAKMHLKLFPDNPRAYRILMEVDYEAGEFKSSLKYCDKLLKTEANDPQLYSKKAYMLACLKDIDGAVTCYDKAIELNPNFYDAICDKARLLSECIDCQEEALVTYKQAILLDPNKAEAYMGAAFMYLELGNKKGAVEFSSRAHELEPEDEFYEMHSSIMERL
jgi:tetratricopeptide (TPR) repeat protein